MPTNRDFSMAILVGGVELPEYHKDGVCYVESNLFTTASYTTETSELVQGEVEKQSWPVTPYQVKVTSKSNTPYSYYKVFVDGQKASQIAVHPGKSCVSEGFYDGIQITEFLFSLPRLPQNKKDRVDQSKASRVGLIEVECWNSKVTGYKKPMISQISYNQANKKDSTAVTEGKYIMSTTKMGRAVRETKKSTVEDWTLFNVRSQLTVKYVMGHALVDMGFKLRPIRIPIHRIPASVLNQPYYPQVRRKRPGPRSKTMPHLMAVLPPVPEIVLPSTSVIEIDSDSSDVIEIDAKKRKIDGELDLDAFIAEVTGESVLNVDAEDSVDKEDAKEDAKEDTKEDVKEDEKDNSGGTDGTSRVDETGAGTSKDAEAKSSKNNDEDVDAVKIEIDVDDDVSDANKDGAGSREKSISEKSKDDDKAETNGNEKDSGSNEEGNDDEQEAGEDRDKAAGADAGSKDVDEDPLSEKEMQAETEDAVSQDEKGGDENTKTAEVDEDVDKNSKEDEGDKDDSCDTKEGAMDAGGGGGEEEDGDDVGQTDDNDADKESAGKDSSDMVDGGGSAGAGDASGNSSGQDGSGDGEGRSANTSGEGESVPEVGGSGDGEGGNDGEGGSGDGEGGSGDGEGGSAGEVDGDDGADSGSEESNTNSNIEKLWEIMGNNTPDGETTSETATDTCNNLMEEIAKFAPLDL